MLLVNQFKELHVLPKGSLLLARFQRVSEVGKGLALLGQDKSAPVVLRWPSYHESGGHTCRQTLTKAVVQFFPPAIQRMWKLDANR